MMERNNHLYKTQRAFYPDVIIENVRSNIQKYQWAKDAKNQIEESAQSWVKFSDDELWNMMFGNTITRSWMVWSDGYCPNCKNDVRMYNWKIDALKFPWKVRCPHCNEFFPKNDFYKFYRSGLDEHGIFDPQRADRSLLFNAEHPDQSDSLHYFGVDDGEGYIEGNNRWRFIGAYLIYGQWKQAILGGIRNLASAYIIIGDRIYAHKALVLLDRVADVYPTHDFKLQGKVYERQGDAGYVSTWHDACEETRELALAYDQVFEALKDDSELVNFLSQKSKEFKLDNPKTSYQYIQKNIEDRILRDAIENSHKIHSNYPRTEIAKIVIKTILGWNQNRDEVYIMLDEMIKKATAVDGVTGEKGLAGYSAYTIQGLALFLAEFSRIEPNFLKDMLNRYPQIHQTFRFFIDTWCFQQYYPLCGDTGSFAGKVTHYVGVPFSKNVSLYSSMYSFFWNLYELTGDTDFVKIIYYENGNSVDGLPYDLFTVDPESFQRKVEKVIASEGAKIELGSVNKQQWHLAILRSGKKEFARALWVDYDSGGGHGHADGMNLGLFAKGLDLMPDFGYPPVQYGGWGAPRSVWYTMSSAHNTVVVDGKNSRSSAGKTTLWIDEKQFQAIRVSGSELINGNQFERTAIMVNISEQDFYVIDIFRVIGGKDHAKFMHSHFGQIITNGLSLSQTNDYGYNTQMRNFLVDPSPQIGWNIDWKIDDYFHYLSSNPDLHLRYTDLTIDAKAYICEAWISPAGYDTSDGAWIPRVMVRRQSDEEPLSSTFVSIIEPYEDKSKIAGIHRLPLENQDNNVAIEIRHTNGVRDLIIAIDVENQAKINHELIQEKWGLCPDGELCVIRVGETNIN